MVAPFLREQKTENITLGVFAIENGNLHIGVCTSDFVLWNELLLQDKGYVSSESHRPSGI